MYVIIINARMDAVSYLVVISCLESYLNTTYVLHPYCHLLSVPIVNIRCLKNAINKTDVLGLSISVLIILNWGINLSVICTKELTATLT